MKKIKQSPHTLTLSSILLSIIACICVHSASAADAVSHKRGLIEGALTYHPNLMIAQVQVEVDEDQAQLHGLVDSHISKALAEEIAANVKGIRSVSNQLRVTPRYFAERKQAESLGEGIDHRLSNVTISNKVKSQLLANRVTSGMNVEVETSNRVVTINGEVPSEAEKALAYWVVRNTQGVRSVVNNLDVSSPREQQAVVHVAEQ